MHTNKSISMISGSHNYHNHFSSAIKDSLPSIRDLFHTQDRFVLSHYNKQCGKKLNVALFCTRENKQTKNPNTSREPKHTFVFNLI